MTIAFSRWIIVAAALTAIPLAGAMAQNNPTGNLGSNRSATASPATVDNKAAGMDTGDVNSKTPRPSIVARNSDTPGGTGRTVVPGDNSTRKGDHAATANQKSGSLTK